MKYLQLVLNFFFKVFPANINQLLLYIKLDFLFKVCIYNFIECFMRGWGWGCEWGLGLRGLYFRPCCHSMTKKMERGREWGLARGRERVWERVWETRVREGVREGMRAEGVGEGVGERVREGGRRGRRGVGVGGRGGGGRVWSGLRN